VVAALVVVLALTHAVWMGWMGSFLVKADEPFHADIIVVLAGDPFGHRILKAAEMVKQGFAAHVLVSGAPGFYDMHESDLAVPFAVKHGYPAEWFIPFPHEGHSTDEEARAIVPELRKRGAHRVIIVTSDYHSRRALRTFLDRGPDIEMRMVAVPDEYFTPHGWWHTREGRKTFFLEWTKTLASLAGL
jgi:uncharacterized SAM-binding protein YcdF (DUF218 family)